MEKKPPVLYKSKKKENTVIKSQPQNTTALRKMLQKQNMEILRVFSQKEFSEVLLGSTKKKLLEIIFFFKVNNPSENDRNFVIKKVNFPLFNSDS